MYVDCNLIYMKSRNVINVSLLKDEFIQLISKLNIEEMNLNEKYNRYEVLLNEWEKGEEDYEGRTVLVGK